MAKKKTPTGKKPRQAKPSPRKLQTVAPKHSDVEPLAVTAESPSARTTRAAELRLYIEVLLKSSVMPKREDHRAKRRALLNALLKVNASDGSPTPGRAHRLLEERGPAPTRKTFDVQVHRLRECLRKFNANPVVGDIEFKGTLFWLPPHTARFEPLAAVSDDWAKFTHACWERRAAMLAEYEANGIYDPNLYVSRERVEKEFQSFLRSAKTLFCLVGLAGRGKTALLCQLAREFQGPAILISGNHYQTRPFEFPGAVESMLSAGDGITNRLSFTQLHELAETNNQSIVIFLDALNAFQNSAAVLEDIFRWALEHGARFPSLRLCLACREESWRYLTEECGVKPPRQQTYYDRPPKEDAPQFLFEVPPSVRMEDYTAQEFNSVIQEYRRRYPIGGIIPRDYKKSCRDPFLLKLALSSLKAGAKLPKDPMNLAVFELFWDRVLGQRFSARQAFIHQLCKCLTKLRRTSVSEAVVAQRPWFDVQTLRQLLDTGVLVRHQDRHLAQIAFFHDRFLEYALARCLYEERHKLLKRPEPYLATATSYEPLAFALAYLLQMVNEAERTTLWQTLLSQSSVNKHSAALGRIFAAALVQEGEALTSLPRGAQRTRVDGIMQCICGMAAVKPEYALLFLGAVIEKVDIPEMTLARMSLAFAEFPEAKSKTHVRNVMEKWFAGSDERLMIVATYPHLAYLFEAGDAKKSMETLLAAARHKNRSVRLAAAPHALSAMFDNRGKAKKVIETLLDQDDEQVAQAIAAVMIPYLDDDPRALDDFLDWAMASNVRGVRLLCACICGRLLEEPSGKIWDTMRFLVRQKNAQPLLLLFSELARPRLRSKLDSAYDIPEVLTLLTQALKATSAEWRRALAHIDALVRLSPINKVSLKWHKGKQRELRHFAQYALRKD